MTEQEPGTSEEQRSLTGDVAPAGPGRWVNRAAHEVALGLKPKALYRRVHRGQMIGRNNPETGEPEVWVPDDVGTRSPGEGDTTEEPRSLAVPDPERYLALLEEAVNRAVAPLALTIAEQQAALTKSGEQAEELTRENERLRVEAEARGREQAEERRHLAAERERDAAEIRRLADELEAARRPWWRKLMGG